MKADDNLEFPERVWSYRIRFLSSAVFMAATVVLVVVSLVPQLYSRAATLCAAIVFLLSLLLRVASQLISKYGYRSFRQHVRSWVNQRYGIILEDSQLTALMTPQPRHDSREAYWSKSFGHWFENTKGRKERTRLSLMMADGQPILFQDDKSVEFMTLEEKARQVIVNDFVQEASGNERIYVYTERNVAEPLSGSRVLIWSDELRATLFMNGIKEANLNPVFVLPVDTFMEQWVPEALAKNVRVGINWDDNDYVFNLRKLFVSV